MKLSLLGVLLGGVGVGAADFEAPVRMRAGGEPLAVEEPGFAAPCWADIDADGDPDLLVGQFRDGKITVCRNEGGGKLARGEFLKAEGEVAQVPGVW